MVYIASEMKTDPWLVLDAKTYSIAEISRLTGFIDTPSIDTSRLLIESE